MAAWRSFERFLCLFHLLQFYLFWPDLAVRSQNLNVVQSPETVSVAAGETLTLNCTLFGANLPGGVRWYKDSSPNRILIYTDKSSSRGERAFPGSTMDFTIRLRDIQAEDAGTYFCIKLRAGTQERVAASGKGTKVSVIARPVKPSLRGPKNRMRVGSVAVFNCTAEGFSPQEIEVIWSKGGRRIQEAQTKVLPEGQQGTSFRVESIMEVLLTRDDMESWITCEIHHSTLAMPLKEEYPLSDILRGSRTSSMVGLGIGIFLNKVGSAFFLLFLFRRKHQLSLAEIEAS